MYNFNMKQGVNPSGYDQIASQYDDLFGDDNPYYQSVNCCERELFDKWVKHPAQRQAALDVGCGTGFHTKWLVDYGFDATGLDHSGEMIRLAKTKSNSWKGFSTFNVMDVSDLEQMPKNCYSVVLCLGSSLNHFDNWKKVAKLIAGRLSSGGMFLFSYDNVDGIDVIARVLLRQFAGYTDAYVREVLFGRMKARIIGEGFNNHWCVRLNAKEVQVPLRYEHTKKWRLFLNDAKLDVLELRGTHLLDCFDRSLLQASAGVNPARKQCPREGFRMWFQRMDRVLARRLHYVAAHVVGIAVKR